MQNQPYSIISVLGPIGILSAAALSVALAIKSNKTKELRAKVDNLQKTLEEMDEQAKLLVSTDMELNNLQEELDKKITGLYSLQKLSRTISTTLEEDQIFTRVEPALLEDLGFEKSMAFLWNEKDKKFVPRLDIGYAEDETGPIASFVDLNKNAFLDIIKTSRTLSSISLSQDSVTKEKICNAFKVNSFIVAPILPKEGNKGFFFVGTENAETPLTEGDEELITILANQIGQALENARLFETTWRAHQELENKVKERTRELTLALEEVKNISKRKTDFVSSVSHELRTPLTSVKGYASILLASKLWVLPDEVRARLEKINKHTDELVQFVNDLLDISRIESGKVTMKQEAQDLTRITAEVSDLLGVLLKEKKIGLSCNIADDAKSVFVDYNQIKRVFINIINNALKFTPPGGKITIKSYKAGEQAQIDISDTGCGIPEEAQSKIFEEFYRVDNPINQEVKGTGLGLTLVKNIIEAHKGKIWVKSKVGTGSTFSFTLPQP